jgi:hypothetical protein
LSRRIGKDMGLTIEQFLMRRWLRCLQTFAMAPGLLIAERGKTQGLTPQGCRLAARCFILVIDDIRVPQTHVDHQRPDGSDLGRKGGRVFVR